ncbi:uncharacterized protein BO72DRAFT_246372 [Aspergillus fijiensis CBS 313.89]|uniref:Uncharacterized protein n=1 Tax=Aspergillus fijiensis CBS 313.89 TaxID=1448319 RepID=A0A8G1RHC4_9EURO|nr:uncharacterized protein BO72DRAFT_246372 [Aspergillus fijiensis CBS 313.89]RAK73355.1 hypothetical protein BO72DRAFT_246372 [Aspergillus fijiensis CBS 313.89]
MTEREETQLVLVTHLGPLLVCKASAQASVTVSSRYVLKTYWCFDRCLQIKIRSSGPVSRSSAISHCRRLLRAERWKQSIMEFTERKAMT